MTVLVENKQKTKYNIIKFLIRLNQGLLGLVKGLGIVSAAQFVPRAMPFFVLIGEKVAVSKRVKTESYLDLLATKIAEIKLSELGYRFIPGIYPVFRRIKQFIEVKARIIKPTRG